ncbi:MAG: 16S rRNA (cytosine(1402)-N(4))-methyltransferase RsmH, partial [Chlamydiota bacterium]
EGLTLKTNADLTLGAAGHAFAVLEAHPEIECFIGLDQDESALALAKEKLAPFGSKVQLFHSNFCHIKAISKAQGLHFDGLLADLGVSSMQLDQAARGMSFSKLGPLDMRMDPSDSLTAAEIVNRYPEDKLAFIFREWGEEPAWRKAAKAVVEARKKKRFVTTLDLVEVLIKICIRKPGIHPLTRVFQGLRIATNKELEVLERLLEESDDLLTEGGRIAIISFHSLEDRLVKQKFRQKSLLKIITKKPLIAEDNEIALNPRSRSAKMRIAERIS